MRSIIERRLLINYRADPELVARRLPAGLSPLLVEGQAIVGICLIRFGAMRPRGVPRALGLASENAAHRVAVVSTGADSAPQPGVFIPRRDTSSALIAAVAGRWYGEHHRAAFDVEDSGDVIDVGMTSDDGSTDVHVRATCPGVLPADSVFGSEEAVSAFFRSAPHGYSPDRKGLAGVRLDTKGWSMEPVTVTELHSALYDNLAEFPAGTITFDSAMLMRAIDATWSAAA